MFQYIRDRVTSWVAYIIIGLLILSFSLWGVQEYFGGSTDLPVAVVNGNEITQSQLSRNVQERRQTLSDIILREEVVEDMVRAELLRQAVGQAGFKISDTSLVERIQRDSQFQIEGRFDPALYKNVLESQLLDRAQWENELREQGKLYQFENSVAASSFVPKTELQRFQKISEQTRDFDYTLVNINQEEMEISEADIERHYNENKQLYKTQEQIKLSYIELQEQDLIDSASVSDEDAQSVYDSQSERFVSPETRRVSHILFKVPSGLNENAVEWDVAMEKAQDIIKQLEEGADFTELAEQHSEDTLSAERGGDIGFIAEGDLASEDLEEALFSLVLGGYSEPVKTEQGVQIVQLAEIQASEQESFEAVREKIINELESEIAQNRFNEIAEEIANMVVEQPDDLLDVSEHFDLPVQQTRLLINADIDGIFSYPEVKDIAFSEDVLQERLNSDLIEVDSGHIFVIRVEEHKEPEQRTIESVKQEVESLLAAREAAERASKRGEELIQKIRDGGSLDAVAEENDLEMISYDVFRRDDNRVPAAIRQQVFNMLKPEEGGTTVDGLALEDGSFVIIELAGVEYGSDEVDGIGVQQLSRRVNYGLREFSAVADAIRKNGDVKIFEDRVSLDQ